MQRKLDHHAALIYTMVMVSAADRISDAELDIMTYLVEHLPIFQDFDRSRINDLGRECAELLDEEDGLDLALELIADALPAPLRETAYALACDVVAADGAAMQLELRMLEMLRHRLNLDRLVASAIERAASARHRMA